MSVSPLTPQLILASRSPQRINLLTAAGYRFATEPADIDEANYAPEWSPSEVVLHLARGKAKVVSDRHPDAVVLAADTVVAFGDTILGKPTDAAHAKWMIELLSGTTHIVITGVAVMNQQTGLNRLQRVMSTVHMRTLTTDQIDRYVASGDWQGKAGGYGIQNVDLHAGLAEGDPFIRRTAGSESNIIGLPMEATKILLEAAGVYPG